MLLEQDDQRLAAGERIRPRKRLQRRESRLRFGDRQLSLGHQTRAERAAAGR